MDQKAKPQLEVRENSSEPFQRWGKINTSLHKILNTQKFGDIYSVTTKEEAVIKEYIMSQYPILRDNQVQFKIGKVPDHDYEGSTHLPSQKRVFGS